MDLSDFYKGAPPAVVGGGGLLGVSWSELVLILTAVYTVWLIASIIPKTLEAWANLLEKRRGRKHQDPR